MVFTNGFLFSHIELDALVSLLLDGTWKGEVKDVTTEQLCERFRRIDADHDGGKRHFVGPFHCIFV